MKAKKIFAVLLSAVMITALAACSNSSDSSSSQASKASAASTTSSTAASTEDGAPESNAETTADASAAAPDENAGFTELPIGEKDLTEAPIHIAAVYFQPVEMKGNGQNDISAEGYNIHLEADISALENELGFGKGDWIPYLTVDYKVEGSDNKEAAAGTFMVMNADDGPHYGANIKLDKADTYKLTFTLHSPIENGYLLHVDEETGVKGRFWEEPITVTFDNWDYTVQEW